MSDFENAPQLNIVETGQDSEPSWEIRLQRFGMQWAVRPAYTNDTYVIVSIYDEIEQVAYLYETYQSAWGSLVEFVRGKADEPADWIERWDIFAT